MLPWSSGCAIQSRRVTAQLVGLIAQFGGSGGVDCEQCALRVDGQQHFWAALKQRAVSLLADAQRFFCLFPGRNVPKHSLKSDDFLVALQQLHVLPDPQDLLRAGDSGENSQ
jgi:hypothetical protein